ncbi:hypothetical protein ACEPAF_7118 [Sanghuangporus sanghuang]|uniref:Uncharacterized protein n=1 Tax=Sanghuangporus baumii TaxID=108892 RepID=A0A9Q5I2Z4_SANBA|nr:hypothetical protein A7U60_g2044 [Sanghuangporus baumii]
MSQSAKLISSPQKDAASLYLEALTHAEKLVEAQPSLEDKSSWRKWARQLINYEVHIFLLSKDPILTITVQNKTLTPRERRAPRLTKYSESSGERFLAVMKIIEATGKRLKSGDGGPSSSGESEPEETSTPRRSARRLADQSTVSDLTSEKKANDSQRANMSAPNLTDALKTINYEIPCSRCARAGIACAGKEGRACFTCRAHRQGCDLSSRAIREKMRTEGSDKEAEERGSASTAAGSRRSAMEKGKGRREASKETERELAGSEANLEAREARPRRAATFVGNTRMGSPKPITESRISSSALAQRKRRATDADLSVADSLPPGPSSSKRARSTHTVQREEHRGFNEPGLDREEVRDALLLCEAAFRQLRKALRL